MLKSSLNEFALDGLKKIMSSWCKSNKCRKIVIAYMINLLVTIFFHAKITIPLEHIFMHCSIG